MTDTSIGIAILYRLMIGLAGLSMGFALILGIQNVKDGLRGDRERFLWALVRFGYVGIMLTLMPLILTAREQNLAFNWQSWLFLASLSCESLGFAGIMLFRRRNGSA